MESGPSRVALGLSDDNRFVRIRSAGNTTTNVFAVPLSSIPEGTQYDRFGTAAFGGDNWDRGPDDPAFVQYGISRLGTLMVTDEDTREPKLRLADHFVSFLRIENTNEQHELKVVLRVFLVTEDYYAQDDRRHVIEMDKFSGEDESRRNIRVAVADVAKRVAAASHSVSWVCWCAANASRRTSTPRIGQV